MRTLWLLVLSWSAVAAVGQTLLVVNQSNSSVSFVDGSSGRVTGSLDEKTVGVHGHEIAVAADGKTAFLPVYGSAGVGKPGIDGDEMLVIDLASRSIVDRVQFGHGVRPHLPVLDAATGILYVTTELDRNIAVIDPKTHKILGSVPTGAEQSHMLVLSHDGRYGYTANVGPGSVSVLDMRARKTLAVIPVAPSVQRIAISNDDRWVFTSDNSRPRMAVIATASRKVERWIELPGLGYGAAPTADGRWLLVAIPSAAEVAVVDLSTMKVVRRVAVKVAPQEILIRPDQQVAYVSCAGSGQVSVIDLKSWAVQQSIATGPGADGLAWAEQVR
jgi:DNA-binding beta-propeller fold protein YncE